MPRPRARILGAGRGGGGPIMDSRGSESEAGEGALFMPFVEPVFVVFGDGLLSRSLALAKPRVSLVWDLLELDLLRVDRRR